LSLVSPAEVAQETLDSYTSGRCRVMVLRANHCNRIITGVKEKYDEMSKQRLQRQFYINTLMNMPKFLGIPCYRCSRLVPVGSKCVTKKTNYTKVYHMDCARKVNLI
jgi:hypothetical protein